jgi:hypothetical protein
MDKNSIDDIHPSIPRKYIDNIDSILENLRMDLMYDSFDAKSSPKIYDALNMRYLFSLGANVLLNEKVELEKDNKLISLFYRGGLMLARPKNYEEIKQCFNHVVRHTSSYLKLL